jgi:DNA-binding transcriptional LysR family regulator
MQIESLKTFCDLAETHSFTKTAQINEVTQSAVSQTISTLEHRFRSLLIERSKRHFRLTREGDVVYDFSKRILELRGELLSKLAEIQNTVSGDIRVSTIYSIGLHVLPPYLTSFMKAYPTVNLHVEYRHPLQVYDDVLGNRSDLGLVAFPWTDSKLECVQFRKEPLVLICHPEHPFAKLKTIKLKDLKGQKFIGFKPGIPTRKALDSIFKRQRVTVEHVMEFDNIETLKRAVEIGSGVAIVPQGTIKQEVAKDSLKALKLDGHYVQSLGVIYRRRKVLSPAIKKFLALLKNPL